MIKVLDPEDLDCLWPFVRRLILIELYSTFVSDPSKVDEENFVYIDDPTLKELYQSPLGRHLHMTGWLLPLMNNVPFDKAIDVLNNPTEQEIQQTIKYVKKMARSDNDGNDDGNGELNAKEIVNK
eukprot:9602185-Karenia_brevis.AAC.1